MLTKRIRKFFGDLKANKSGNAMLLVAMGAPVLMGTAGMGVDMAQYYLWKREIQYAADQSALAGAWLRGNGDLSDEYKNRARQEFAANLSVTKSFTRSMLPTLQTYDGIADNSVQVVASVTSRLPFTNFVLGSATKIEVKSQATWETTEAYTACLFALDPSASKALLFSGGPTVNAACGVGAISDADDSVHINGNSGTYDVGWVVSGGGVSDSHDKFASAAVMENLEDMNDPFEDLTPPDNPTPQSLDCGSKNTQQWTADETKTTAHTFKYYKGKTKSAAEAAGAITYNGANKTAPYSEVATEVGKVFTYEPTAYSDPADAGNLGKIFGSGPDTIYEQPVETDSYTYNITAYPTTTATTAIPPGTFDGFEISCDTVLQGGIYVINGGNLKVNANNSLTGDGVMFVLKNGAGIEINGGANIDLAPMDSTELMAAGVSAEDAEALAGMLIFEDPNSSGTTGNSINGDANTHLNGVVYLPNSGITISGSMEATSECLMIASKTLTIGGGASLATMCPAGVTSEIVVAEGGTRVRLVS